MTNTSIFERLKSERKRLKLTQIAAAELAGVKRETWSRYESGVMAPGMEVLAALASAGADIQYVLTGNESGGVALSRDEKEIVENYRMAPLAVKSAVLAALASGSNGSGNGFTVSGNNNRVAGRDYKGK
ncbi:helix-turn-helix domain-containing protein [Pectobacterium colocasium]|uniref:helix-turn-helix domain-containing protein n=1 Tax=Pectobacterium colocasium TaxID=2878098 RepID=UPI003B28CEEE